MTMKDMAVGDKVRIMWPKDKPMMCVVGHVTEITDTDCGPSVQVRFAGSKPPVDVLVDRAKVWAAGKKAECGYWIRFPKGQRP